MTKTNENIINRNFNVFDIESLVRQDFLLFSLECYALVKNIKNPFLLLK